MKRRQRGTESGGTSKFSVSNSGNLTAAGTVTLGSPTVAVGTIIMNNLTAGGTLTISPPTGALGGVTATLPDNTGTVAEVNYGQTWSAAQTYNSGDLISGTIRPSSDSTTAIEAQNASGSLCAFTVDSTNSRLEVGTCAAPGATFDVNSGHFSINNVGKVTQVANEPTATSGTFGVVPEFGVSDNTSLSADLAATTVLAVPAGGSGIYDVLLYEAITRIASGSSTMPTGCVIWTDADSSQSEIVLAIPSSIGNLLTTFGQAHVVVNAKASTNVQIATGMNCSGGTAYGSVGTTTMQYKIRARLAAY